MVKKIILFYFDASQFLFLSYIIKNDVAHTTFMNYASTCLAIEMSLSNILCKIGIRKTNSDTACIVYFWYHFTDT